MTLGLRLSNAFPFSERPRRFSQPVEDRLRQGLAMVPDVSQPLMRLRLRRIAAIARRLEVWAEREITGDVGAVAREAGDRLHAHPRSVRRIAGILALGRAVCRRTLGMRPYDVQLMGAAALLEGRVVEMETGEGKTLTAALAAAGAALSGRLTHVVTVNDYLARRDAELLKPFYTALGLSVGLVMHDMLPAERRKFYTSDIVYVTNKELTFDYLRDQLKRRSWPNEAFLRLDRLGARRAAPVATVLQGLHFAIVDEADSILIDEARTPLILSATGQQNFGSDIAEQALFVASTLAEGEHYQLDRTNRSIELTNAGHERIKRDTQGLGATWRDGLGRTDLVQKALSAIHIFERDIHYLVADGKVQIIDEYTGRLMPDRFWSDGLHQMVEVKEGITISDSHDVLARITYQRFFTRYWHLCGMSGTLKECERELREAYRLKIARIPTHRPSRRRFASTRIHATAEEKWKAIARLTRDLTVDGRAVLVGTRTVAASRLASQYLAEAAVDHVVLNAAQDEDEAAIVARAGQAGRVTVATNLAGRGTDIHLTRDVAACGGLAVILTERHEAARIDRQLAGRCGRQGEPGTVHVMLSLDDALLDLFKGSRGGRALISFARRHRIVALWLIKRAQRRSERIHYAVRRELLRLEERLTRSMAFSGPPE